MNFISYITKLNYSIIMIIVWIYGMYIWSNGKIYHAIMWWLIFGLSTSTIIYYMLKYENEKNKLSNIHNKYNMNIMEYDVKRKH